MNVKQKFVILRRSFESWYDWWLVKTFVGLNPPWEIDGRVVFDPSLKNVYEEEIREEERCIERRRERQRIIDDPSASKNDKSSAAVVSFLDTKEGRRALAKAMCKVIKKKD